MFDSMLEAAAEMADRMEGFAAVYSQLQTPAQAPGKKMAELFLRSHLNVDYKTHPINFSDVNFVRCAAVAPFTIVELRTLFGDPNQPGSNLTPKAGSHWQWRRHLEQVYVDVVEYPGESHPTIFSTGIIAYREFLDFMEEGTDVLRNRQGSAC